MRLPWLFCLMLIVSLIDPTRASAANPPAKPADVSPVAQMTDAVVRINNNGNFVGTGVVLTPKGHIITTGKVANDQAFQSFTIGPARTKAKIIVHDSKHDLVVLLAETPLPRWATLDVGPGPAKNDVAYVIARVYKGSDPPMIELRTASARIEEPHFSGDSATALDLSDLLIVRLDGDGFDYSGTGYAVVSPKTGRLQGIMIGRIEFGQNRLLAMSAATIRTVCESNKIVLPSL